ncbi:YicC family protein [Rhodospirillum rubrum]|uniref:YicC/YloC family endoribonuclease n=1 Tax=Rhodospirillum rubrum TaxID=1085 RepID=UPI0019078669|nr:YicC/YloC family endoribonuclease [Rhodospirillum rubrum]MBK1663768.1 YicC family protein [Rhodospirillum rubrum]MBK1676687.1 YicC family protein [Rhodospirillum rubrum]
MALSSMTGFARTQGALGPQAWVWEVRSVNGKGLDVRLRLPSGADALDQPVRRAVAERFKRGNFSLSLTATSDDQEQAYRVNEPLLKKLLAVTRELAMDGVDRPRMDGLLGLRGVLEPVGQVEEDGVREAREAAQLRSLEAALDALALARSEEGGRLAGVLTGHLEALEDLRAQGASAEALRPDMVRARLRRQMIELLEAAPDALPEERLAQELALLAVKADIREELDRLGAHLEGARDLLTRGEAMGRRLEFLSQELNREANTLCSKSSDVALTRIGLEMKAVIDQFREQILNIE